MSDKENDPVLKDLFRRYDEATNGPINEREEVAEAALERAGELARETGGVSRADRLGASARRAENDRDWAAAEKVYVEILEQPDLNSLTRFKTHSDLSGLYGLLSRADAARGQASLATEVARARDNPYDLRDALIAEGGCHLDAGDVSRAELAVEEALSLLRNTGADDQLHARILVLQAECALARGRAAGAAVLVERAITLLESHTAMKIAAGIYWDLASAWKVAAQIRQHAQDATAAIDAWRKAIAAANHVMSLPHASSVYVLAGLAMRQRGLATALREANQTEDAARLEAETAEITSFLRLAAN